MHGVFVDLFAIAAKQSSYPTEGLLFIIYVCIGGIFIAPKVRAARYTTIVDPFQKKYGPKMGGLLFISEFFGDVFWEAAIFGALGKW